MTRDPASPAANVAVPILVKGQLASWGPGADDRPVSVADLSETDIKVALEWRATRLTFDLTPLKDVVDAFNLYNTKKLQLGDTAVASRTVSGEFRADNLDGFVWALPAVADATIEHVGDDLIVIKSKR